MANIKLTELSELISVDNTNTIIYAADLSVSPNVSHYLRVGSISSLTDYTIANAAFLKANTALSVGFNANTALNIANLGFAKANAAHIQANTATTIGGSAFNRANDSTTLAQSSFNRANSASAHASAAYNLSNTTSISTTSSFNRANSAFAHATASYNYANTINLTPVTVLAQAAFNKANNAVMKAGDNITGIVTSPTAALATSNNMIATTQFVRNEINSIPQIGLGIGQTWQDVSLLRAFNVDYTNNTGKPIMLVGEFNRSITTTTAGTLTTNIDLIIGGVQVPLARNRDYIPGGSFFIPTTFTSNSTGSLIIPPGAVYKLVNVGQALTSYKIFELR